MIVGSEDRVEAVLLLIGEQSDAGADRFADPVQVITRPAPTAVKFGLQSSSRLIELRTDQGDYVEGVHDRGGIRHHFSGGLLVAGEGIHSDVVDAGTEVIWMVFQPVGEDVG